MRNRTLGVKMDPHIPFFFRSYVLLSFCCSIYLEGQEIHAQPAVAGIATYYFRNASQSCYWRAVKSPYYLFVSWTFRRKAFFGSASPELTHYGPVVTVGFTGFNTHKLYVLPTQCMYLYGSQDKQRLFPHYCVNSLDFVLRRGVFPVQYGLNLI